MPEYICVACDYSTTRKCNYNKHCNTIKHYNNISKDPTNNTEVILNRKYQCSYCNVKYSRSDSYNRHVTTCIKRIMNENKTIQYKYNELLKQNEELLKKNSELLTQNSKLKDTIKDNEIKYLKKSEKQLIQNQKNN